MSDPRRFFGYDVTQTSEIVPSRCDLPLRHHIQYEQTHYQTHTWQLIGDAGSVTMHAQCLIDGPELPQIFLRDSAGAQWMALDMVFHGVAPWLGSEHFPGCVYAGAGCWSHHFGMHYASHVMRMALQCPEPTIQIHRALMSEYFLHFSECWLDVAGALSW